MPTGSQAKVDRKPHQEDIEQRMKIKKDTQTATVQIESSDEFHASVYRRLSERSRRSNSFYIASLESGNPEFEMLDIKQW